MAALHQPLPPTNRPSQRPRTTHALSIAFPSLPSPLYVETTCRFGPRGRRCRLFFCFRVGAWTDGEAFSQPLTVAIAVRFPFGLTDSFPAPSAPAARCSQRVGFSHPIRFRESVPDCHPREGVCLAFHADADAIG